MGVIFIAAGTTTTTKAALKEMVYEGFYPFNSVIRTFENNPTYKKIELPFIDFSQGKVDQ